MTRSIQQSSPVTAAGSQDKGSDRLWTFFGLTSALTLLTWGALAVFQMPVAAATDTDAQPSALAMLLYLFGGSTPTIVGLFMAWRFQGRAGLRDMRQRFTRVRLGATWYLVIVGVPISIVLLQALVYALRGGAFVTPAFLVPATGLIPVVVSTFIAGPLSEEFGWRGFALDRVQARWGAITGSLILGLIWGVWHVLLFVIPGTFQQQSGSPAIEFALFTVHVVAMTVLFTWIYNNTGRSIWGAVLFHFMVNFSTGLLFATAEGAGIMERAVGIGAWIVFAFVVILRQQRQESSPSQTVA